MPTVKKKPPRRGRPPSGAPEKKPHTTYLSASAEDWLRGNLPRAISASKFISAAVDAFIAGGKADAFIADMLKPRQ